MSRKYNFDDVNTSEKPAISACQRKFGDATYHWQCKGRSSVGYGYTPEHAYRAWEKNWRRRLKFYGEREQSAQMTLGTYAARLPKPKSEGVVCRFCGASRLRWVATDLGWRLFSTDDTAHLCFN